MSEPNPLSLPYFLAQMILQQHQVYNNSFAQQFQLYHLQQQQQQLQRSSLVAPPPLPPPPPPPPPAAPTSSASASSLQVPHAYYYHFAQQLQLRHLQQQQQQQAQHHHHQLHHQLFSPTETLTHSPQQQQQYHHHLHQNDIQFKRSSSEISEGSSHVTKKLCTQASPPINTINNNNNINKSPTTNISTLYNSNSNNNNNINNNNNNNNSKNKNDSLEADQQSSTALSSLSNFVTETLAPILNGDKSSSSTLTNKICSSSSSSSKHSSFGISTKLTATTSKSNPQASQTIATTTSSSSSSIKHRANSFNCSSSSSSGGSSTSTIQNNNNGNNINHHRKSSSSTEPDELLESNRNNNNNNNNSFNNISISGDSKSQQKHRNTLDLISSAAQNLKAATGTTTSPIAKTPLPDRNKGELPAWVYCTRYSDRPSSGPRTRRAKSKQEKKAKDPKVNNDEKRPRTAFTSEQLDKLRQEFQENSYLDEKRRKDLAERLCLNENQIKIWFQNKRAKMKKQSNQPNRLRVLLVAGGLYNHSTATSDCSESYANGNDHEDIDDDNDDCSSGIDDI